jgi:high-affinity Fe2+/Pb2+ permease
MKPCLNPRCGQWTADDAWWCPACRWMAWAALACGIVVGIVVVSLTLDVLLGAA